MRYWWVLIGVGFSSWAHSSDESHKQVANQLFNTMNIEHQIEAIATDVKDRQAEQIETLSLPEEAKPVIDMYLTKSADLIFDSFRAPRVRQDYVNAYTETFSEEELQDVLAFYQSPTGQKFLAKASELNGIVLTIAQQQMDSIQPQLFQLQSELKDKLKEYVK